MEFGNFKTLVLYILFLTIGNQPTFAQQQTKTSEFLYDQLDYFLKEPSGSKLHRLSKLIASKEDQLTTNQDKLAWVIVHTNMGYYHHQYGNIPTAIMYYEKAQKMFFKHKLNDYDIIENCLQPLGNLYLKIGDLQKAENTITNYLYLAERSQHQTKIIAAITNLSIAYNNQSNFQKAIKILKKGEALDTDNVNILTNLATNYLDSGAIVNAESYAKKVISLDPSQVNASQILAAIALEKNDFQNAQNYVEQAKLQLLKNPNTSSRDLAKWQLAYIDMLLSKSSYQEALKHIKEIYTILLPKYATNTQIPETETLIPDRILLKTLDVHAYVLQQLDDPNLAIKAYEAAFEVNSKLNLAYPLQSTKIIQHSQNRNRTELYIDLLYALYTKNQDPKYVAKAFEAAENSKAPFVNEALVSKQILSEYKNDPLIIENERLTKLLALFDINILREKQKNEQADISKIQHLTSRYSNVSLELKELTKKLQKKYPNLLSDPKNISVSSLQKKLLQDDLTLIEYFFGNQTVYQFQIDGRSAQIKVLQNVERFKKVIGNYIDYFNDAAAISNNVKRFSECSADLYNLLEIPDAKKLLIVADGLLNFIPFEALLTEKSDTISFDKMPFLLKSSIVNYEVSAGKYLRSKDSSKEKSVLGVFPVFENSNMELSFSLEEQRHIAQKFPGLFLAKEDATYPRFLEESINHNIIHLSTHAEGGSFSKPASIEFRDQSILVNELYGLQLEADLVVLSACETGIGTLAKGEGPLSIGRGFQYAGVQNVLFSLWKVNDKTTAQLMQGFYHNLYKSDSYTHSLHKAKLDFLGAKEISNTQKSPYYWASFIYYGKYQPSKESAFNWIYIISGFLFIMLFLFVIRQKTQ